MVTEEMKPKRIRRNRKAILIEKPEPMVIVPQLISPRLRMRGVNLKPKSRIIPARAGTKQATLIDALFRGTTLRVLRDQLSQSGKPWSDSSIKAGFVWDVNSVKGYGVRSVFTTTPEELEPIDSAGAEEMRREHAETGSCTPVAIYHLVLPKGMDAPLPHAPRKG